MVACARRAHRIGSARARPLQRRLGGDGGRRRPSEEEAAKQQKGQKKGGGGGGGGGQKGLTTREADFSLWYQEVIAAADLVAAAVMPTTAATCVARAVAHATRSRTNACRAVRPTR